MNQSNINVSTTHSPTPCAHRAHVVSVATSKLNQPTTPSEAHTIVHNGAPCVVIPLSKYQDVFEDAKLIKSALNDYHNLIALLVSSQTHPTMRARAVNSLHSIMHLALDIHTDIIYHLVNELASHLPQEQQQAQKENLAHLGKHY